MAPLELAGRLALALGLSVFLGLAFEEVYKREERSAPGGIRTFPLLTLSGAMLFLIEPQHSLAYIVGLIALAIWVHPFLRDAHTAPAASLMIPVSSLVAYLIGPIALTQAPWLAVGFAVSAVLFLGAREELHRFIRVVPLEELLTAGKFLILVGIILPLVPDQPLTQGFPLTPYRIWMAVVAVCSVSYLTYVVQKYGPAGSTTWLPAVLGGLYSSTATTVVLAKRQRAAGVARPELAAAIVAATAVMYLRLGFVIALFDWRLAGALAPALIGLSVLGAALALHEWRWPAAQKPSPNVPLPAVNPLQIPSAIAFAALFVLTSAVTTSVRAAFGQSGILALSAIVGVTDIDPFVINIAQGGLAGLSVPALCAAVLIAASSNNIAKAIYALGFAAGEGGSRRSALMLFALALSGYAAAAFYGYAQPQF
jgi:uncharacterized membrane protein (DUF4010 family)